MTDSESKSPEQPDPRFSHYALERARLVFLAMFPPPVTGAATITQVLLDELTERGVPIAAINTSVGASALPRSLGYHARRLFRFAKTIGKLERIGRKAEAPPMLYCVPDGGAGLWYTAAYLLRAREKNGRLVLHHHTFGYIDRPSRLMRAICKRYHGAVTHVFLSSAMRDAFFAHYDEGDALVCTNARYIEPRRATKTTGDLVIGHLSNLCEDKGFFEVADTFEAALAAGLPVRLELAGPIIEEKIGARFDALSARYGARVFWHGPLYGDEKDAFYDRLHVFLFPTKWKQEAQPLVIYEAFAGGAAALAFDRGCIADMIPDDCGKVIGHDEDFVRSATDWLSKFWNDPARADLPDRILRHLEGKRAQSLEEQQRLFDLLEGP